MSCNLFTDPERVYSLSERLVGQFFAEFLLRPADRFNFDEFMVSWKQSLPEGMNTNIDYLRVMIFSTGTLCAEQYTGILIKPRYKISKPSHLPKPPILLCCIKVPWS